MDPATKAELLLLGFKYVGPRHYCLLVQAEPVTIRIWYEQRGVHADINVYVSSKCFEDGRMLNRPEAWCDTEEEAMEHIRAFMSEYHAVQS